ncbi:MAG: hypothetical protein ACKOE4_00770 [Candidatus Kapaibacterium sp.]
MDTLEIHIAGGDVMAERLIRTGRSLVIAWREALADGPVQPFVDDLFAARSRFVELAYGAPSGSYQEMVVDPFIELTTRPVQRAHLHFDTDLFCCVNLMFLATHLRKVPELVWTTSAESSPLSLLDRVFLHSCWHAFAQDDPRILEGLIEQAPVSMRAFLPAMQAHLQRFPSTISGMGRPQEIIDELIDRGIDDDAALISAFQAIDENRYGWGDLQIRREIEWTRRQREGASVTRDVGGCVVQSQNPVWQWDPSGRIIICADGSS